MASLKTDNPIQLVQITDTHLYGNATGTLVRMNTHHSFELVLKTVKEHEPAIDLILATGDIAQDATPEAYKNFASNITDLKAPFRWIPGNHDNASVMTEIANGSGANEKSIRINNWLILMLDTSIMGQVHGQLAPAELDFLGNSINDSNRDDAIDHVMICLHHNPVQGNAGWMKDIGLHNKDEFWKLAKKSEKIRCVVYGLSLIHI